MKKLNKLLMFSIKLQFYSNAPMRIYVVSLSEGLQAEMWSLCFKALEFNNMICIWSVKSTKLSILGLLF